MKRAMTETRTAMREPRPSPASSGCRSAPWRRGRGAVRGLAGAIALALVLSGPPASAVAAEAEIEASLAAHAEAELERALELLERSVEINSGTQNHEGVREVGALFGEELEALGFETRWIDGAPFQRAGHLVAEREGGPLRVLLIGHLDTVFPADSPFQRYERLDERRAKGPGVHDMKGGNVILVQALRALREAGRLDALSLRVVLTGDEESRGAPMERAVAPLVEAARWAQVALGFENGDGDPTTAVVARRGASTWELRVRGKPAHSSQIFREDIGAGAIFEAARILDEMRRALGSEPNLTFNPGVIVGGTEIEFDREQSRGTAFGKANVIAEGVRIVGDLRALSPEQRARAVERMQAIVAESLPQASAELDVSEGYPPMPPLEGNRELLSAYDRASRDLGYGPVQAVDPRRAGAADISFAAPHVERALDGLGLMGTGGHTVEEIADLDTLVMQIRRVALLLHRLGSEGPASSEGAPAAH